MNPLNTIEVEAMLIRKEGAWRLRKDQDVDFIDALSLIVLPSPEVLEASLSVATASGPGSEAQRLVRVAMAATEPRKSRVRVSKTGSGTATIRRRRKEARSESLDATLARL